MQFNDAFPRKYINAADLGGRDLTLTIRFIQMEDLSSGETKPVMYFNGTEKGMVLNRTNANTISGLHGLEMDHWSGKQVTIFATQVDFRGDQVPAIRVRMNSASSPAPAVQTPAPGGEGINSPPPATDPAVEEDLPF